MRVTETAGISPQFASTLVRGGLSPALVHDYLLVMRGAERVFAAIADCWPEAPIYTTVYSDQGTLGRFWGREIRTSHLQRLRVNQERFRVLLPLYPGAVESLPVREHGLVVSSSSAFAHGIRPAPGTVHVCYCHTPFRYVWHERDLALDKVPRPMRPLLSATLRRIQRWDIEASERVTHYIANSRQVQERIALFYGRDSEVVHPPVELERFSVGEPHDYFLMVGELVPHKRTRVALEGARLAGQRVKVVGGGPELAELQAAFPEVAFVGRVSDQALAELYSQARALLIPGVEEFGITSVESQASGRPVVAVGAGGALETVVGDATGILLERGDADEFAEVLREVDFDRFDPHAIEAHAARFSPARFRERFRAEVERATGAYAETAP